MANIYSKTQMKSLVIEDEDGSIRTYRGYKLNSLTLLTESFKILKAIVPSIGTIIDGYNSNQDLYLPPQTYTAAAQMLENNLSEEHFQDLVMKLTGNLICNKEAIDDWNEHFDKYIYDLPEIIVWVGKENFADFFTQNHLVRSKWKQIKEKMNPQLLEMVTTMFENNDIKNNDTKEENGNDI